MLNKVITTLKNDSLINGMDKINKYLTQLNFIDNQYYCKREKDLVSEDKYSFHHV
jgi:hypothetical protein